MIYSTYKINKRCESDINDVFIRIRVNVRVELLIREIEGDNGGIDDCR